MRSLDGRVEGLYNKDGYSIVRTSESAVASTRLVASEYRDVLASLAVSDKARAFLVAHYYALGRTASMEELAIAVGYASYEPANLHYGRLGHSVADRLSCPPDDIGASGYGNWVQSLAQATGEMNGEGHFLWTQRPEVASALESLGWVRPDQELVMQRAGAEKWPSVDGGTTRDAMVAARKGQQLFRHRVLQYWGGTCSVTGCKSTGLLLASHIKPWADSTDDERLDGFNGLLLTPNLDRLFDKHLISFDDKGYVLIARSLSAEDRLALGLTTSLRVERLHERHLAYLSAHRDRFQAAEG
jgi:hypothetical protein